VSTIAFPILIVLAVAGALVYLEQHRATPRLRLAVMRRTDRRRLRR
jgi:hypothetical protein